MLGQLLAFLSGDSTLSLEIAFVSYKDSRNVVTRVLLNFRHPVLNSGERFSISNVIGHNYAVCSFVVAGGNSLEAFLASCIPDLELDCLLINIDSPDLEVDTNCRHEVV